MPTIAVYGAGPALGLSVARRFAAEGYDVALVARNAERLDRLVTALRADGVTVTGHLADLTDRDRVRAVAAELPVPDVIFYGPGDVSRLPVPVRDLDSEELQTWLPLNLLTPIALARAVLPGMLARGTGALLVALGVSAAVPIPDLASSGTAQAALRHYLGMLAADVTPRGVYIGAMLIGGLIRRSAAEELLDAGRFDGVDAGAFPRLDPDELAARLWTMAHARDTTEVTVPAPAG